MLAFPVVSIVAIRVGLPHQRPVVNFPLAHAWQSPAVTLPAVRGQTGQRPAQARARLVPDGGMGRILLAGVAPARLCAMLPAGVAPLLPGWPVQVTLIYLIVISYAGLGPLLLYST